MTKILFFLQTFLLVVALIPFSSTEGDAQSLVLNNFERYFVADFGAKMRPNCFLASVASLV